MVLFKNIYFIRATISIFLRFYFTKRRIIRLTRVRPMLSYSTAVIKTSRERPFSFFPKGLLCLAPTMVALVLGIWGSAKFTFRFLAANFVFNVRRYYKYGLVTWRDMNCFFQLVRIAEGCDQRTGVQYRQRYCWYCNSDEPKTSQTQVWKGMVRERWVNNCQV